MPFLYWLTTPANRLKSKKAKANTIMKTKKELFDMLDEKLASIDTEVETRISRFYSDEDNLVIATESHEARIHEAIAHIMRQLGYTLYDIGGNAEYHMFTFKKI